MLLPFDLSQWLPFCASHAWKFGALKNQLFVDNWDKTNIKTLRNSDWPQNLVLNCGVNASENFTAGRCHSTHFCAFFRRWPVWPCSCKAPTVKGNTPITTWSLPSPPISATASRLTVCKQRVLRSHPLHQLTASRCKSTKQHALP